MTSPTSVPGWAKALAAFDELVELDPKVQQARLAAIGSTDPDLQRELQRLLAADERADTLLARVDNAMGSGGMPTEASGGEADPLHLVGRAVSHFRIVDLLAHGGMGVVYRAEDMQLRRAAALKFPLASQQFDPRAKERFLHEARVVAALDHPNICGIHETGETADGHLFHAMPLYEGETLKSRLAREGALPFADALFIAKQIAHGLGAAHRAGIVHRDLKPGNVMLLRDGTVKILDFGLAKVSDVSLTGSWSRLGTVSYMAPEQIHGRKLDGRNDLWAAGVVMFEMLTGSRPFAGEHEISVAHAILHEEPARASGLRRGIAAELDEVIHRLLRKEPAKRFQSAEELLAALSAIQLEGSGPASGEARPRIAWPHVSARRLGAACIALVAVGLVGWLTRRAVGGAAAPRTVAVLPFTSEVAKDEAGYLAIGLADGIRTELARLRGLVVPSYLTSSGYQASAKPLGQIASELQADALLLGAVRRLGDSVRLEARLVEPTQQKTLWSRSFERPLSEILDVQRQAIEATVSALRVKLNSSERSLLRQPPTGESRAYHAYLRGRAVELAGVPRDLFARTPADSIRKAQSFYTQARDLDPNFAVARARLALAHTQSAFSYDTTDARREQARLEAETALRQQPELPEAHEALANYWSARGEVSKAIDETKLAIKGFPNSADLRLSLGGLYARVGRLEEAVAEFDEAMRLEPGSPNAAFFAAIFYLRLRRDEKAMAAFDRAIALEPSYHMVKVIKGHTYLRWKGIPDTMAAALQSIPASWDPDGMATYARYTALRAQRRYADALAMIDQSNSELSQDGLVYQPRPLLRAQLYESLGERAKARANYAAARALLQDSASVHPNDASIRIALGLAHAGLGQRVEAVREARRAMELVPLASNTPAATAFMGGAVEVFAKAGEIGPAIELLELLFSMPAGREVTVAFLRVWPAFDPLRSDPRFEQLLERFPAR